MLIKHESRKNLKKTF